MPQAKRGRPKAETTKVVERAIRRTTDEHGRFVPLDVIEKFAKLVSASEIPLQKLLDRWYSHTVRRVLGQRDEHGRRVYVCVRGASPRDTDYWKRFMDLQEYELALVCSYRGKQAEDLGRSHSELVALHELVAEESARTGRQVTVAEVIAQLDGASV